MIAQHADAVSGQIRGIENYRNTLQRKISMPRHISGPNFFIQVQIPGQTVPSRRQQTSIDTKKLAIMRTLGIYATSDKKMVPYWQGACATGFGR
ncbi:hypothetical protein AAV32_00190 [Kerstersia gyiorum]|uniref:Uncharacterized protein n=1 Tax=Kerstersia gyiorum TaxID=206506 RepID=A0A171KVB0_9BURK|nr:hypothetical protein AAV32_00190 [Kerstersia gyiorum]